MMPSIVPRKVELQKDYSRGEIILYEKSGKLLKNVFILCCKYVTCHGIKVSNNHFMFGKDLKLSFQGFCVNAVFHYTLPPFDGLENFRTKAYI